MENEVLIIPGIIALALGIVAIVISFFLIKYMIRGAIILFAWAGEQGFIGLAVYFACWFFMLPLMGVVSIVVGAIDWWGER